jgi:hypothetical protein
MPEKTLQWEALQTIFSAWVDIFYPANFRDLEENRVFQQPRLDNNSYPHRPILVSTRKAN